MIRLAPEVAEALRSGVPVVALETSIVAQGLPAPHNLEVGLGCEAAIRAEGAVPATVAVLDGSLCVGLEAGELERLAGGQTRKVSSRDLGPALAARVSGATTVAATMRAAALAGIRFLATGGIGGVHRGHPEDESADLSELARSPVAVFCAGVKMVLDIGRTLERLESLGVPVLGYGCDEFPAFYSRLSGCPVAARVDGPEATARALAAAWATGSLGVVVAQPPSDELAGAQGIVEQALAEVDVAGPGATPALLARVADLSGGRSVGVNVKLVIANATTAARCARAWSAL